MPLMTGSCASNAVPGRRPSAEPPKALVRAQGRPEANLLFMTASPDGPSGFEAVDVIITFEPPR